MVLDYLNFHFVFPKKNRNIHSQVEVWQGPLLEFNGTHTPNLNDSFQASLIPKIFSNTFFQIKPCHSGHGLKLKVKTDRLYVLSIVFFVYLC